MLLDIFQERLEEGGCRGGFCVRYTYPLTEGGVRFSLEFEGERQASLQMALSVGLIPTKACSDFGVETLITGPTPARCSARILIHSANVD
jgi:hypothetical protein